MSYHLETKSYFSGLKKMGKESGVILEYPNEGHYLKQPQNNDDLSIRNMAMDGTFFKRESSGRMDEK